ncbi:hypothetical protein ACN47E_009548 [Coniothyrium glycines]
MPISEADVLRPVDPAISDSNDWEIFVLSDAQVVYESNGKPANLLVAYADTPLKVTGRLEPPVRHQLKCLLKKPFKAEEIEVRNVTRFSYGEMTDSTHVIWAQGKAGWFEIRPSAQYRHIFDDMVCAVELLYFVSDIYSEPRKRGGGPGAQLVFQEYAEDERFACSDLNEAEQIFDKHHVFLTMSFLARAQGIGWSNTPLYQYFRRKYPKDFDACKARVEGRYCETQTFQQTQRTNTKAASAPVIESRPITEITEAPGVGRGETTVSKPILPRKDDNWWEAAALFEFMQKAVNQRVIRVGRNQITLARVAELVVKRYEIEEIEAAKNVLLVHAPNLCYMMLHPRRQSVRFFVNEPVYRELAAGHNLTAAEQRRAEGVELRPRKDHATLRGNESDSSVTSDLEDNVSTPVRPTSKRKRGRLSVLRPKSSKTSGKRQGKGVTGNKSEGKGQFGSHDQASEEEESDKGTYSEDDTSIGTFTQVTSLGRDKRKLDHVNANEETGDGRRKRVASASITPESPPSTAESDFEDAPPTEGNTSLPLRRKLTTSRTIQNGTTRPMLLPLVSTPLPTYEANASRDSWICSFDGCSQRIYGCSKEIGRQLITEHLEDHSKGREKVVGILWREQDKLHLPVDNLIKRIREMSEASTPLYPPLGVTTPHAVQRSI